MKTRKHIRREEKRTIGKGSKFEAKQSELLSQRKKFARSLHFSISSSFVRSFAALKIFLKPTDDDVDSPNGQLRHSFIASLLRIAQPAAAAVLNQSMAGNSLFESCDS